MSTADLAVIAITGVSLAHGCWDYRIRMRMADRVRVVNPVKAPQRPRQDAAAEPAKTGPVPLERAS